MVEVPGSVKLVQGTDAEGVWRIRVSVGRDPLTKQPKSIERRFHGSKQAALSALDRLRNDPRSTVRGGGDMPSTLHQLLQRYLDHLMHLGREANTIRSYKSQVEVLGSYVSKIQLARLGPAELDTLYARLGQRTISMKVGMDEKGKPIYADRPISTNTIKHYHALINGALRYAYRVGWVTQVATDRATLPRVPRYRAEPLTIDEVQAVVETARTTDADLAFAIELAIATGCRRGELCGLQWQDLVEVPADDGMSTWRLHVRRAVIEVPAERKQDGKKAGPGWAVKDTKTHSDRALALDPFTAATLLERRSAMIAEPKPDHWILADLSKKPWGEVPHRPEWLTSGWSANRPEGMTARFHDLRHLHLSLLLAEGIPVREVSDRGGHAQTSTTLNMYAHVLAGRDQRAADVIGRLIKPPKPKQP